MFIGLGGRRDKKQLSRKELESLLKSILGDEYEQLRRYAEKHETSLEQALRELVRKGYRYHELETMYGDPSAHREVWDKRWYYFRVEAAYLNCRLRLRDVINDLRGLAMTFSSTVAELETMYKRCGVLNENAKAHLERLRGFVDYYMETYIHSYRRYVENTSGEENDEPSEEEVIESVKEALKKYEKLLAKQKTQ